MLVRFWLRQAAQPVGADVVALMQYFGQIMATMTKATVAAASGSY